MKADDLRVDGPLSEGIPLPESGLEGKFPGSWLGYLLALSILPISLGHAADVSINLGAQRQEIDGFGASSAWCGTISDKVMNSLYGDLGFSILRVRIEEGIGDNWKGGPYTSWASELANAKKAKAKGAIVFASPWNPPANLRIAKNASNGKYGIEDSRFPEYRDYLNSYVKYFKDNGADLYAISIQNEPDYAKDWTYWSPTQVHDFVLNYGGSINTKLISAESFQYLKNLYDPTLNDAKALENIDILGTHLYGTSVTNFAYPLFESKARPSGKKVWMTEHFLNEDDDMTKTIMPVAKEIHDCMVTGNMSGYVYWWITWANGLATSSGTIFKRAYVIGQFAKHIRPGYHRVDATATPASGLYVSAYSGAGKAVVVAVNTGSSAVTQRFSFQGGSLAEVATSRTTATENMADGTKITLANGSFSANLPAQSITTFVGTLLTGSHGSTVASAGFRTRVTQGRLQILPPDGAGEYDLELLTLDGHLLTSSRGIRAAVSLRTPKPGAYLLSIHCQGRLQREMITAM